MNDYSSRKRPIRISVIIPTHNRSLLLRQAIESVLNQQPCGAQIELLVVDDDSTDDTREVIAEYASAKYLRSQHGNAAGARNVGIAHATGDFIAFLDDDDVWLPEKLKKVVAAIESEPEAQVFFSCAYICDHKLQLGPIWRGPEQLDRLGAYQSFLTDVITPSVVVIDRAVFDSIGLFDTRVYRAEDRDLCLRMARAGFRFVKIPDPLVLYRGRDRLDGDMTHATFRASMKILERELGLKHRARPAWRSRRRIELKLRGWYAHAMLRAARQEKESGQPARARRLSRLAFTISPPHWLYHRVIRLGKLV